MPDRALCFHNISFRLTPPPPSWLKSTCISALIIYFVYSVCFSLLFRCWASVAWARVRRWSSSVRRPTRAWRQRSFAGPVALTAVVVIDAHSAKRSSKKSGEWVQLSPVLVTNTLSWSRISLNEDQRHQKPAI